MPGDEHSSRSLRLRALMGHRSAPWVLASALSLLALIQAIHRAGQGRCALLKWGPAFEAFFAGGELYGVGVEGYPTLPLSLLVMSPFHVLGPGLGAGLWAVFKIGLAWWIVSRAFRLLNRRTQLLGPGAQVFVIVICFRPLLSDITHGNINLLVGATLASAAWSWAKGKEFQAGLWIGLGAVLKVTPILGVLWLLRKGSWRGLLGVCTGVLFGLAVPTLVVGWSQNSAYVAGWWTQMIEPYLASRELTLLQTEHINQSLFGVLARYLTESVAIPAVTTKGLGDISIHVWDLGVGQFHRVHQLTSAAVLAFLLWRSRRRSPAEDGAQVLAEFSMLALAMLFLSERSWKHHYVLLVFPVAFLTAHWVSGALPRSRRLAAAAVLSATVLFGGTGSAWLGEHGSNLAEAYGVFLLGGMILFLSNGLLADQRFEPEPRDAGSGQK